MEKFEFVLGCQVFLDLDAESGRYAESRGGPIAGQTRITLRYVLVKIG